MESNFIIHPRPSSIVASLYTLRDLRIDVIILHGPPGCSFKHARLLELDNVHVLTSSMNEDDFVFGAKEKLKKTIQKAIILFNPKSIAIVGTCTSMIIGENLEESVTELNIQEDIKFLFIDIHAGYSNNTYGVIAALKEANKKGMIDNTELKRQEILLNEATLLELQYGAASDMYLEPSYGDLKYKVAIQICNVIKENKKILCILNSKKETTYMFADNILAIHEVSMKYGNIENINYFCNLDHNVGLNKTREDAKNILNNINLNNIKIDEIIGGLDEYAITKNKILKLIKNKYNSFDLIFFIGVPNILSYNEIKEAKGDSDFEIISITNGPRQVIPLKKNGHSKVIVEIDLHPKTLGIHNIINSEFGMILRSVANDNII